MKLKDMNERQLLLERIKYDIGKSNFSNSEINNEVFSRMEKLSDE